MEPALKTLKTLFALSRNECAFPGCPAPIVESESETISGVICHINARSPEGPRYDPEQTDDVRHSLSNLILLCGRHHKIVDTEVSKYSAELLRTMQATHRGGAVADIGPFETRVGEVLLAEYRRAYVINAGGHVMIGSPGAVQGTNVTIKTSKKKSPGILLPVGVIGSDVTRRPYVKYLIDRYAEFAKNQPGREFKYPVFYSAIKAKFKMDWKWIPTSRFEELCQYLQGRIDSTLMGRINRSKGHKNYADFSIFHS